MHCMFSRTGYLVCTPFYISSFVETVQVGFTAKSVLENLIYGGLMIVPYMYYHIYSKY